ncbi:PorP/SprF family type IX secretion system membrane protein [Flammeovirga sp. SubArs3]|uniref:PorP/SprF family type IX secretion system membrane protein n=1 Tax=Flammeovirga sp. SubArs3 TaxID=2995316 RepID=UPI00248BAE0F|nr:PorP/SprF family type IX secretion system membrane protein [Flammeovirga sp. SubArs3]
MKKLFIYLMFMGMFVYQTSHAQSPLFSQYNTSNLYTNPATVGMTGSPFVGKMGVRDQWSNLDGGYQTQYASFEMNTLQKLNVGFLASNDIAGHNGLNTINLSGVIGYVIPLNKPKRMYHGNLSKTWYLQPALQLGIINKAIRSQYKNIDDINNGTPTQNLNGLSDWFPELGFGLLVTNKETWFGVAAHHLFQTGEEVDDINNVLLPPDVRYTVHGGILKELSSNDVSVGGSFILRVQAGIYQSDFTVNASKTMLYKNNQITIGGSLGYRTFIDSQQESNRDAIIIGTSVRFNNFEFGYSYDYTISNLTQNTMGTNEYSIVIYPSWDKKKKWEDKYKKRNHVSCPSVADPRNYR